MIKIFVIAKTNAREDSVEKIDEAHFKVRTKELPLNGRANLAIIKLLAEYLDIPKTRIQLERGFSSKEKVFSIS